MNLKDFANYALHNEIVANLAESQNISFDEAKATISKMSFAEYHRLEEAVVTPPSGQTIAPTSSSTSNQGTSQTGSAPSNIKAIWPGKGAPVEVGMTVGLKGPNGLPVPGQVSQVDMAAKGVKVKNPTTGQDEWANIDALEPFMAKGEPGQNIQPGQQPTAEDVSDLARMRKLAGIKEDCSGGATGAGAIAVSPAAMGTVKRRTEEEEQVEESPSLEHPVAGRKTIVGATGPQASAIGRLSANNAARGKKTANRINNGAKR